MSCEGDDFLCGGGNLESLREKKKILLFEKGADL